MNDLQIIRPSELAEMLSVSKQTIWRMERRGDLPARFKISKRAVGWTKESIREFLESKQETETVVQ